MEGLKEKISPMNDYFNAVKMVVRLQNTSEIYQLIDEIDELLKNESYEYLHLTKSYKNTFKHIVDMVEISSKLMEEELNDNAYKEMFMNSVVFITEHLCNFMTELMDAEFQMKQLKVSNATKIVISYRMKYLVYVIKKVLT
ncbi:MAG: hypothetical protein LPK26_13055 [Bacillaceae bacterium]|nr:hypothetical protein [Bacillaceae bacterium]